MKNKKIIYILSFLLILTTTSAYASNIAEINFEGLENIEENHLKEEMILEVNEEFSMRILERDIRNLKEIGYFEDIQTNLNENDEGEIVLDIKFYEKTLINEINFKGNEKVSDSRLKDLSYIEEMSIPNQKNIEKTLEEIENYYKDKGYSLVSVYESRENGKLIFDINEGEINSFHFKGISGEDEDLENEINRNLLLETGEVYENSLMQRSISRLRDTGSFSNVSYSLDEEENIVKLEVNQGSRLPFGLGLRYDSLDKHSFIIGYNNQNIFGSQGDLKFYTQNGKHLEKYKAKGSIPSFLNSFFDLSLSAYHVENKKLNDITTTNFGTEASLSFSPVKNLEETLIFGAKRFKEEGSLDGVSEVLEDRGEYTNAYNISLLNEYDTLDEQLKLGEYLALDLSVNRLETEQNELYDFAKIDFTGEKFIQINDTNSLYGNLNLGTSISESGLAYNDKYYLDNLRGFSRDYFEHEKIGEYFVNDNYLDFALEYHFTPFKLQENDDVWGEVLALNTLDFIIYFDGGQANNELDFGNLYYSSGLGVNAETFLGNVSLTSNFSLDDNPDLNNQSVSFEITNEF